MDTLELDHVFVFVTPGAPEAAALGLCESYRRRHPGQGTANVCYCFDNAYLELLWVTDRAELTAPAVARTRLAERADWRRTGASPFGIALRGPDPDTPLPFESWDYAAPFLPAGMAIPVAVASDDPRQPFLFRSPGTARPDAWPRDNGAGGRAGLRQRPVGLAEIAKVHLSLPADIAPAPALCRLAEAGLITLGASEAGPQMVLTLTRPDGTPPRRLTLPDFVWS